MPVHASVPPKQPATKSSRSLMGRREFGRPLSTDAPSRRSHGARALSGRKFVAAQGSGQGAALAANTCRPFVTDPGEEIRLRVTAVAVLEFLAGAAGTGLVAADLAPALRILRIARRRPPNGAPAGTAEPPPPGGPPIGAPLAAGPIP